MRWAGDVAHMGLEKRSIQGFDGETCGRYRGRWVYNVKMNLQEV